MTNPYPTPDPEPADPFGTQSPYSGSTPYPPPYGSPASAADPYAAQGPYAAPQPGYAPYGPPPGYAPILPDHPQATMVLILGILSIVGISITGPFAWYFGNKARAEITANPGKYKDGGMLTAGRIMGIIGTALLGLGIVLVIFYVVFLGIIFSTVSY